jgi:hypothetical protein
VGVSLGVEEVDEGAPVFCDVSAVVPAEDEEGGIVFGLSIDDLDLDPSASLGVCGSDGPGCVEGAKYPDSVEGAPGPSLLIADGDLVLSGRHGESGDAEKAACIVYLDSTCCLFDEALNGGEVKVGRIGKVGKFDRFASVEQQAESCGTYPS